MHLTEKRDAQNDRKDVLTGSSGISGLHVQPHCDQEKDGQRVRIQAPPEPHYCEHQRGLEDLLLKGRSVVAVGVSAASSSHPQARIQQVVVLDEKEVPEHGTEDHLTEDEGVVLEETALEDARRRGRRRQEGVGAAGEEDIRLATPTSAAAATGAVQRLAVKGTDGDGQPEGEEANGVADSVDDVAAGVGDGQLKNRKWLKRPFEKPSFKDLPVWWCQSRGDTELPGRRGRPEIGGP